MDKKKKGIYQVIMLLTAIGIVNYKNETSESSLKQTLSIKVEEKLFLMIFINDMYLLLFNFLWFS